MNFLDNREESFAHGWPHQNANDLKGDDLAYMGFYRKAGQHGSTVVCGFCSTECDWASTAAHPVQFHLANSPCSLVRIWGNTDSWGGVNWKAYTANADYVGDLAQLVRDVYEKSAVKWPYGPGHEQVSPSVEDVCNWKSFIAKRTAVSVFRHHPSALIPMKRSRCPQSS